MTLLEKLSVLSRVLVNDTDNFKYVNVACSFFLNNIPTQLAEDFYIEEEIPENGKTCGLKYSSVVRNGVPCRAVPANLKRTLTNSTSEYSVTKADPVFYKEQSKIFIIPVPTEDEKAYVFKIPSTFIPDNANNSIEKIPNIPQEAETVVLIYAAYLIVAKSLRELVIPDVPEFENDDLSDDIVAGLASLDNAFKFVGSLDENNTPTDVPTGAFWLDDEDPEMVQSASQLAAQEVNRANSYFNKRMQRDQQNLTRYSPLAQAYQLEYQSLSQEAVALFERYQVELRNYFGVRNESK